MKIAPLQDKDIPKLHAMLDDLNGSTSDIRKLEHGLSLIKDIEQYKLFCVYTDENTLVGTCSLTKCFDLTGNCTPYYSMENFVIDKVQRGKGYGTYLVSKMEEYVTNNGGRYVNFTSSSLRTDAHAFYKKCDYDLDYVKGFKKVFKDSI